MGSNGSTPWAVAANTACPFLPTTAQAPRSVCAVQYLRETCRSEDHDGCPTFLAAVLSRSRPSHRRTSLTLAAK